MGQLGDPFVTGYQANYQLPNIQTTGTTNVFYGAAAVLPQSLVAPPPELEPLAWLRGQVDEICDLASTAA